MPPTIEKTSVAPRQRPKGAHGTPPVSGLPLLPQGNIQLNRRPQPTPAVASSSQVQGS